MKLSRRILAMILALVMITASFPIALAEEAEPVVEIIEIVEEAAEEPAEEPKVEEAPAKEPEKEPEAEEAPAEETEEVPEVEEAPAEETEEEPEAEEAPAEETEEVPEAEEAPAEETEEVPEAEEAPAEETEEVPEAEEAPAEETEEVPEAEETPAEETEEVPEVEEAPAEEEEALFSEGYAAIAAETKVYSDEALETEAGAFEAEAVVYVTSRIASEEVENDVFAICYAVEGEICTGYIAAADAAEMTADAVAEYEANAEEAVADEETGALLLNCAFAAVPAEEETEEDAAREEPTEVGTEEEVPAEEETEEASVMAAPEAPLDETPAAAENPVTYIEIIDTDNISGEATVDNLIPLSEGMTRQLFAVVTPENADNREIEWSIIEGDTAASISSKGLVTAKAVTAPTRVVVKAASAADENVFATYNMIVLCKAEKITVMKGETAVSAKTAEVIERVKWVMNDEDSGWYPTEDSFFTYDVIVEPAGSFGYTVKSSNEGVVTAENVDGDLKLVGWSDGTAKITLTTQDGAKSFSFNVKVQRSVANIEFDVPLKSDNGAEYTIAKGKSVKLPTIITSAVTDDPDEEPTDVTNKALTWTTSNKSYVTVSNGTIKGIKATDSKVPYVTITAEAKDGSGVKAECRVTVTSVATSTVSLSTTDKNNYVLWEGEGTKVDLEAAFTKDTASPMFTWSVDDEDMASVEAKTTTNNFTGATLTFKERGSVKVTAKANDGSNKKATITVTTVDVPVKSVTAVEETIEVAVGKSVTLNASMSEEDLANADYPELVWETDKKAVATVSNKGVVKGVKKGDAVITVKSKDGFASDTVNVKVFAKPASKVAVKVKDGGSKTINFSEANTIQLTSTVTPSTASQKVVYKSGNEEIATVDANGLVTFKKDGTVKISATAVDGSKKSASISLTAARKIKNISVLNEHVKAEDGSVDYIILPKSGTTKLNLEARDINDQVIENAAFTYKSGNTKIMTVTSAGMIKGIKNGTTTITVTPKDGISEAVKYNVQVVTPATTITLVVEGADENNTITVDMNDPASVRSYKFKAEVNEGASSTTITCTSSNEKVAVAGAGSTIEVIGAGEATITIAPLGASKLAKKVKVVANAATISLAKGENQPTEVAYGKTVTLDLVRNPDPATDTLVWEASSSKVTLSKKSSTGVTVKGNSKSAAEDVTIKAYIKGADLEAHPELCEEWVISSKPLTTKVAVKLADPDNTDKTIDLNKETELKLVAFPTPAKASDKFAWDIKSGAGIATVDADGLVKPIANEDGTYNTGTVQVRATATDGSKKSATITLKFQYNPDRIDVIDYATEDGEVPFTGAIELAPKQKHYIWAEARSASGIVSENALTYKSGNTKVATVNAQGVVTAVAAGKTTITIASKACPDIKTTIDVQVYALASSVKISQVETVDGEEVVTDVSKKKVYMYMPSDDEDVDFNDLPYITLKASSTASKASMQEFEWTSSDWEVISFRVEENGEIYHYVQLDGAEVQPVGAYEAGTARLTVKALDGSKKSSYVDVVYGPAANDAVISGSRTLTEGKSTQLTATVFPSNAINTKVDWSVGAGYESKISVDENGKVTALAGASGLALVQAKAYSIGKEDAGKTVNFYLNIVPKPVEAEIYLDGDKVTGENIAMSTKWTDKTLQLTAKLTGKDASIQCNQEVTWSSNNTKAAKVDKETGLVTAVAANSKAVTITATSVDDENVKASIKVKVSGGALKLSVVNENGYEELVGDDGVVTYKIAKAWDEYNNGELFIKVANAPANTPVEIAYGSDAEKNYVEYEAVPVVEDEGIWFNFRAAEIGTAQFTITPKKSTSAALKFNIEVVEPLTELELNVNELKLNINDANGKTAQLEIVSESYDGRKLVWDVIHEDEEKPCVSVDENGLVKALRAYDGDMQKILVGLADGSTTEDGEAVYAECKVKVVKGAKSVKVTAAMNGDEFKYSGESVQLKATVTYMDGTTSENVTWSFDNDYEAEGITIDANGLLTIAPDYECPGDMASYCVYATADDGVSRGQIMIDITSPDMLFDVEKDGDIVRITRVWYGAWGETRLRIPEYVFIEGDDGYERIKWTHLGSDAFPATSSWEDENGNVCTEELEYSLKTLILPPDIVIEEGALKNLKSLVSDSGDKNFIVFNGTLYSYTGTSTTPTVPKGVTKIGDGAFAGNTKITKVTMPNAVTEIGVRAFAGCTALKQITCN